MKPSVFALAVPLAVLAVPSPAGAEVHLGLRIVVDERAPRYPYGYGRVDSPRYGYERGRTEGASNGYKDGQKGRRFDVDRDDDYRDADDGYKGWMGPRHEYARGFRRGYSEGYRRGYEQGHRRRCERDGYRHDGRDGDDWIYEIPRPRW